MEPFESAILPVLPIKDAMVFPGAISPLFVIQPMGLEAVDAALNSDKRIFLSLQKELDVESPDKDDLHETGCVVELLQVLRVPDGSAKILVEGIYTARAIQVLEGTEYLQALLVRDEIHGLDKKNAQAYIRTTMGLLEQYSKISGVIPEDMLASIRALEEPLAIVYAASNYCDIKLEEKQKILESNSLEEKFVLFNSNMEKELQVIDLESHIVSQVKGQIGRSQREFFLNEQMKAIERELGISGEENMELEELHQKIIAAEMPEEAQEKAEKELVRLSRMAPASPEATVSRTYIEWLIDVPWNERSQDQIDLHRAQKILDEDHYGLLKVKERIIEYLAVAKLAGRTQGPILCFVGPPGVGKTSLAHSIARCIGRRFVRMSLGGVRDEAEIRGHRRTYIGAMPGKIILSMKKSKTTNPLFLLDEIDKMSSDFRGDPAAALLEVLDPEQNKNFVDHYLEVDYNLSDVMFITTANTTAGIPIPLQDRMEIIRLSGYTDLEKMQIAKRYLIPRAIESSGLKKSQLSFTKSGLELIIQGYTRESGVRGLQREIQSVVRKIVTRIVTAEEDNAKIERQKITPEKVRELLGPELYRDKQLEKQPEIGNVIGLAWTEVGGEILSVEARCMPGKGNLLLTGKLGDVMKESATTALSYIRSLSELLKVEEDFHSKNDIHVHLPEGAIPKDGPSAGITLATALASVVAKRPVRQDLAMTGEITLRGNVLKIGGLKEKALAAYRYGIRYVLIPEENVVDLHEIPDEVMKKITFIPVHSLGEVLEYAFSSGKKLVPVSTSKTDKKEVKKPPRKRNYRQPGASM